MRLGKVYVNKDGELCLLKKLYKVGNSGFILLPKAWTCQFDDGVTFEMFVDTDKNEVVIRPHKEE